MSQHNLCPAGNRSQAPTTPTNKTCFSLQLPITAQGHNQRTTSRCPPHTPRGIVTSCPSIMAFSLQRAELGSIMLQLLGYYYLAVPHEDHSVHPYILRHTAVSGEKKTHPGQQQPKPALWPPQTTAISVYSHGRWPQKQGTREAMASPTPTQGTRGAPAFLRPRSRSSTALPAVSLAGFVLWDLCTGERQGGAGQSTTALFSPTHEHAPTPTVPCKICQPLPPQQPHQGRDHPHPHPNIPYGICGARELLPC